MGNVTIATPLPVCVKFDGVKLGGCLVNCKGVCVELPLANSKGPVETTGEVCNIGGGGDGDGDKGGSGGGTPDPESKPKWNYFEPSQGDATGTSVSASIAKLNRNLGDSFRLIDAGLELEKMSYARVNEISGDATRIVNASEAAQQFLKEMSEYNRVANHKLEGMQLIASRSENYLEQIAKKSGNSGGGSSVASDVAGISSMMGNALGMFSTIQGNTSGLNNKLDDISANTRATSYFAKDMKASLENIERSLGGGSGGGSSPWTRDDIEFLSSKFNNQHMVPAYLSTIETASLQQVESMGELLSVSREQSGLLDGILSAVKNGEGSGSGGGDGKGIDYSKMPGSDGNPLSVKRGQYNSKCEGGDCFFDVAGISKELEKANKSLSNKQADIAKEVKDIFSFNLSGSADVMDCFELFSYGGKTYQVCPPSQNYWQTLAALMMFIFYFIALMVIFKR